MNSRIMRTLGLGLVLALVLGVTSCGFGGKSTMTIHAYLADSAGLFEGNDVGILGVPVGKVTDIEPKGNKVEVTMEIDADEPVPADAGAVVVSRSVATDRYVELTPVYHSGKKMADGAVIPLSETRTPVDFDQVLASLNDFATGIGGHKATTKAVQRFINAGTAALSGRGPLLNQTIHSLSQGVNGLSAVRGDAAVTLKSLDRLVGTIAANQGTARTFIQQVARASGILAGERLNFRKMLRSLDTAVTTVAQFAVDNRDQIVKALDGSTKLMKTVLTKQNQVAEILRVMPLALQNLARIPGNRLRVRLDPLVLAPLGGLLQDVCGQLGNLCDLLDGIAPGAP